MDFGARLLIWMHLFFFLICCMITGLPYLVRQFICLPNADKNIYSMGSCEDGVDTVEMVTSLKAAPFWGGWWPPCLALQHSLKATGILLSVLGHGSRKRTHRVNSSFVFQLCLGSCVSLALGCLYLFLLGQSELFLC